MTVEEFFDEHYDDPNHFYSYVRGIAVLSPQKLMEAMEAYHRAKVEGMTDERIISMAYQISLNKPTRDKVIFLAGIKQGAMALRDKLLNQ